MPDTDPQAPEQSATNIPEELLEEKILLEWESPNRPYKQRDRKFFLTILGIIILISIFLVYIQEFLLIGVLLATLFVSYALSSTKPEMTKHVISTRGVESAGHLYFWDQVDYFWLGSRLDQEVLNIDTKLKFPGRVIIVLAPEINKGDLKNILLNYVPYLDKPPTNWMDSLLEKGAKTLNIS